jgi:hypothetical protein
MGWYSPDYPVYGSRIHLVAGEPKTNTTLNEVRLYLLESLLQEERVEEIVKLDVSWGDFHTINIECTVKVVGEEEYVHLVVTYDLP